VSFSLCLSYSYSLHNSWTGSRYFSDLVKTSDSRASFAKNLVKAVSDYDLDGIDIDWGKYSKTQTDDYTL
jgi:GH18 family chitinase